MFGFTDIGNRSDHAVAKFLHKHVALTRCHKVGTSNQWRTQTGEIIMVGMYNGPNGTISTYWVADRLATEAKRLKKV
jgi:hypothetical protein